MLRMYTTATDSVYNIVGSKLFFKYTISHTFNIEKKQKQKQKDNDKVLILQL